jgi:signal transduction histidine kinase
MKMRMTRTAIHVPDPAEVPPSRAAAFDELSAMISATRSGAFTSAHITGNAGIGKTHLWQTFREVTRRDDEIWVYQKSPQAGSAPYAAFVSVLTELLDHVAARTGDSREPLLRRVLQQAGMHQQADSLIRTLVLNDGESSLDHRVDYVQSLSTLLSVVVRFAPRQPTVVLTLDDIQWIDPATLEVFTALYRQIASTALVFIGRPEAETMLPATHKRRRISVERLTEDESRTLFHSLEPPYEDGAAHRHLAEWAVSRSEGSPFILVEAARTARQARNIGAHAATFGGAQFDHGLSTLSPNARRLVLYASLLMPPVDHSLLAELPEIPPDQVDTLVHEATELVAIDPSTHELTFRHDRIEEETRRHALKNEKVLEDTAEILRRKSESDPRAAYLVSQAVSSAHEENELGRHLRTAVAPEHLVDILMSGARRAISVVAARDALRFVEAAHAIAHEAAVEFPSLEASVIAHRAAFLLDDGAAMSRYFTRLSPVADPITRNEMRLLWVTRCFTRFWIEGARRIGWSILRELDAVPSQFGVPHTGDPAPRKEVSARARRFLRPIAAGGIARHVLDSTPNTDRRSVLAIRTASRMLLSLLSQEPESYSVTAWIILDESIRHGIAASSGLGFVYWAIAVSDAKGDERFRLRLLEYARAVNTRVAELSLDPVDAHNSRAYLAILGVKWDRDVTDADSELKARYEEGVNLGNYEAASHCSSLYCQWLLFRGHPLGELDLEFARYRSEIRSIGIERTDKAMAKYHQLVEVLRGGTDDPTSLTGSHAAGRELLQQLETAGDRLAIAGYHAARGYLGGYHDAPELALEALGESEPLWPTLRMMFDTNSLALLYGMAAGRIGDHGSLNRALVHLRPSRRSPAGAHRYLAVMAVRTLSRDRHPPGHRRHRRARNLLGKAVSLALANGYPHEAALIAERQADELSRSGGAQHLAIERYHLAVALFERWGAVHAAERVRNRISNLDPYRASHRHGSNQAPQNRDVLSETQQQLRSTREYFQLLVLALNDALFLLDRNGLVLLYNGAAGLYVHPLDNGSARLDASLQATVSPLVLQSIEKQRMLAVERSWNGRTLEITVNAAPSPVPGREAALVIRDVTDARARDRQLIVADRMSSLGMLASTVAHEVSNPNHIVQLNAQLLMMHLTREETSRDQSVIEAAENVLDGARRIGEVVRQITEYGHEGRGEEREEIQTEEICRRVMRFTRIFVAQRSDRFTYENHGAPKSVWAIRGLLEQALINLVKNATEATRSRESRISLFVETGTEGDKQYVVFSVCDQGVGFEPSFTSHDQAPFQTSRAHEGGSGLGLSIVRSIAERHGGTLAFTNSEEYATIAQIRIPVEDR